MPATHDQLATPAALPTRVIAIDVPPAMALGERLGAILELTKPRITRLVTITAGVGFTLAAVARTWELPELISAAAGCLIGTALSASGANALNMWWERRRDGQMKRTCGRPLPQGRITPQAALFSGVLFSVLGLLSLLVLAGPAPAIVSLVTILWYVLLYTPLKPVTPLNTLVGAVPGALPPVIGWAATAPIFAPGDFAGLSSLLHPGGWSLFLLMVIWQLPHFLAIAWMYRDDYAAGGYRMLPIVDPTGRTTANTILITGILLLPATLAPAWILPAQLGWPYAAVALVSGLAFVALCVRLSRTRTRQHARAVFLASIAHLPLLLMAMVATALVRRLF